MRKIIRELETDVEELVDGLVRIGRYLQRGLDIGKPNQPFRLTPIINDETRERCVGFMITPENYLDLYRAVSKVFMAQGHGGKNEQNL